MDKTWGSGSACFNLAMQQPGADAATLEGLWDRACVLQAAPACRMKAAGLAKKDLPRASAWMAAAGIDDSESTDCDPVCIENCPGRARWFEAIGDITRRDAMLASLEAAKELRCDASPETCRAALLIEW